MIDYEFNKDYNLLSGRVSELVNTMRYCLNNPFWNNGVLAVRMDFSISNAILSFSDDIPTINVFECFDKFINRLRRKRINGMKINFVANWKKEYSTEKGQHIHTVFYFNRNQFPSFDANTRLFGLMDKLWKYCTDDKSSVVSTGYININKSFLCESLDVFRAQPFRKTDDPRYAEPHLYTVLTNNPMIFNQLDEYHQQKNYHQHVCGFVHWISYLAKTDQQASVRKSFGTVRN